MNIQPPISETRRQDPMRQAELRVYRALAESPESGHALYEIKARPRSGEVDFPMWLEGVGHLGLIVKGGPHVLEENGTWTRHDQNGSTPNLHLKQDNWGAVMAFHEVVMEKLQRYIFIVPVIVFVDMEFDERIAAWAETGYMSVIFGAHDLVPRLVDLAKAKGTCMTPAHLGGDRRRSRSVHPRTSPRRAGPGHAGRRSGA